MRGERDERCLRKNKTTRRIFSKEQMDRFLTPPNRDEYIFLVVVVSSKKVAENRQRCFRVSFSHDSYLKRERVLCVCFAQEEEAEAEKKKLARLLHDRLSPPQLPRDRERERERERDFVCSLSRRRRRRRQQQKGTGFEREK